MGYAQYLVLIANSILDRRQSYFTLGCPGLYTPCIYIVSLQCFVCLYIVLLYSKESSIDIDYIDGKLDFSLLINISAGFEP